MKGSELEQAIVELVGRPRYKPIKPRVIAQRLGVPKGQVADVKKAIKKLIKRERLSWSSNHLVVPAEPSSKKSKTSKKSLEGPESQAGKKSKTSEKSPAGEASNRVVGVFRRTQRGFGFVRPSGTLPGEPEPADIFIPAKKAGDAASGDVVLVRLGKARGRDLPGPRGEIIEVVERQTHQFVGTYFETAGIGYVQVDGTRFSQPICLGDPGAKNAKPDDKVVVEMVRFPSELQDGEGVITEVLGPAGKPGVDTLSIIREFGLPGEFADDAMEEARQEAEKLEAEESIPEGRLDLTELTVLTIDPADARDFDDAISLERLDNGHWRLGVHIADVSHFVRPKTALDREALGRATSVYLPDQVIPMLPEIISNSLASLQPGKVRYTKTVFIEFTADGVRVDTQYHSAAIKSNKRLNYEQVDEFIADPAPWRRRLGAKVHDLLGNMHELAMVLRGRRMEHGSLELTMPEVKIELDRQGRVSGAHVVENTESHQVIEEFMLAANEAVADVLAGRELHFLRRIHPAPTPRKLKMLTEFVTELGFKTESLESRFAVQKLLALVADRPEVHAVNFAVLRSMQQATYSPEPELHYALASKCYCHFTSPIRRYPDLTVHRLLDTLLRKRKPRNNFDELAELGEHCSQRERRAESAERQLVKLKLLAYMSQRIGQEMDAIVTGVESFGLFVQGVEIPAEGLIHIDSLTSDYFQFDRATHTLSGRRKGNTFRLGDRLQVTVARVDIERRELDFRLKARKKGK